MLKGNVAFLILLSFLFGVFSAAFFNDFYFLSLPSIATFITFLTYKSEQRISYLIFYSILFLAILLLGFFYFLRFENRVLKESVSFNVNNLTLKIVEEPKERDKNIFVKAEILEESSLEGIYKYVGIYLPKNSGMQYGDVISIKGTIETPENFNGFNYRQYLNKEGVGLISRYPDYQIVAKGDYESIFEMAKGWLISAKDSFKRKIENILPQKEAQLLNSIVWGYKWELSEDLSESLSKVGLRHITAISGLHITLLSMVLMELFLALGFWRKQAFLASVSVLFLYIFTLGFPASAVRAGLMGSFLLVAQNVGRPTNFYNPVLLAATFMLAFNPLIIKYDIGFQLSFLAVLGIIFWFDFFKEKLAYIFKNREEYFLNIISMTISAQIFTVPLVAYYFGIFSIFSFVSNLIVIPVLPFIVGFGILGSFLPFAGDFLLLLIWPLLRMIVLVSEYFSSVKLSFLEFGDLSFFVIGVIYFLLACLTYFFRIKNKNRLIKP